MAADFSRLGKTIAILDTFPQVAGYHMDIMDNHFVPNFTFGAGVVRSLKAWTSKPFEAHLMVNNPVAHFEACAKNGISHVFVHIENVRDVDSAMAHAHELGLGFGLAINPDTPFAMLEVYIERLDSLLIMTVNPGFCGQEFMPEVLPKIDEAMAACLGSHGTMKPGFRLIVDGGVNKETIGTLRAHHVRDVVVGSALFASTHQMRIESFATNIRGLS